MPTMTKVRDTFKCSNTLVSLYSTILMNSSPKRKGVMAQKWYEVGIKKRTLVLFLWPHDPRQGAEPPRPVKWDSN